MRTKILLTIVIFIVTISYSNAQVDINRYLIGGSINYYHTSNPTSVSFYSSLQIGKVIKPNTVIGLIGSYASTNYDYTVVSPNKTRSYSTGIFYRKYALLSKKFYFFSELDASYSFSRNILESFNGGQYYNSKSGGVALNFIPGIYYNLWKRLQVELSIPSLASLSYMHVSTIDNSLPPSVSPQKRDTYAAGINLNSNFVSNFAIGFKFLVGK